MLSGHRIAPTCWPLLAPAPRPPRPLLPQVVLAVIMMQVMGEAAAAVPPQAYPPPLPPRGAVPGRRTRAPNGSSLPASLFCAWNACPAAAVSTVYYFSTFREVYLRHVDTSRRPAFTR